MSESTIEAPEATENPAQGEPDKPTEPEVDSTDWKAEARKWEQRAKENNSKATELDKQRKAAMTEAERKEVEAEERGRMAATSEFGKRLATSEIRAAAAVVGAVLAGVFDYLDLTRFVTEDGEPDEKAIRKFVDGLPLKDDGKPRAPRPDRNQGRDSRGTASTADQFAASIDGLL